MMTKWYIHKPESILEKEELKILWGLEIQKNHPVLARKLDLVLINKKKKRELAVVLYFSIQIRPQNKRKWKDG